MAKADGSIIIQVDADDKEAEKKLNSIQKKIERLEDQIYTKRQQQLPLVKQAEELEISLERARQKLSGMEAGTIPTDASGIKEQQAVVRELQSEYNAVQRKVMGYDDAIEKATIELDIQKEKAGEVYQQMAAASRSSQKMAEAQERASKSAKKFSSRLKSLVSSALIFTVITRALSSFRDWLGKAIKTNDEATAAMARLKGALLTLAQPLVEIIIPAFTLLVNILTKVVSAIAQMISMLFGKTIGQSKEAAKNLNAETEALEGVGSAAEDAAGSLAGFDEINTINTETAGGGGTAEIQPDFSFDTDLTESQLNNLLGLIKAIAAGLLAWKLGNGFLDSMKKFLGIALAIDGAVGLAKAAMDAWANGVNWDNLLQMLGRAAELVLGLWLAFGKLGAGIGLIVSGLTMLVVGFHDAYENGWNLQNLLLSIAGILATGLGISVLTGSWIPALIAGIAALLLAITVAWGDGEKLLDDIMTVLQGFKDFFVGVFTGDIELAMTGIGEIFEGLRGIVDNVIGAVKNMFNSFLDWLDEKTHGKLTGLIEWIRSFINGHLDTLSETFSGFIDGVQQVFEGLLQFFSGVFTGDWELAWEGIKNIFKGAWNGIVSIAEGAVNLAINAINALINGFNKLLSMGDKIAETLFGTTVRVPTIPKVTLPRLATGAVIPPNREFMAVLGDQRSGNNIEAPEDLIRKIVREEAGGMNTDLLQAILEAIREGSVMMVDRDVLARTAVRGINSMTQRAGKPVLLL